MSVKIKRLSVGTCLVAISFCSQAASTELKPVADTTLIAIAPTNNMGAQTFVNAGTTQVYTKNRALYKFNPLLEIPPGSKITSASLILEVTKEPDEVQTPSSFALHRVLQPWGEGSKTAASGGSPGVGEPATEGEATWNHRFAFTTNTWSEPGAAPTNDFVADISAFQFVQGIYDSPYTFGPTSRLINDVQLWLDHPDENFGWILVCQNEGANFTARRFGSREAGVDAPRLQIDYIPPPVIHSVSRIGSQLQFSFYAEAGQGYRVETRNILGSGNWTSLTNITAGSEGDVVVTNTISGESRFYRVILP